MGRVSGVRKGVLSATGDFVLFTDADLSTPIEEVEKLLDVAVKETQTSSSALAVST
jgi:dolichyl-phosphate beta-glucosyltransferase